MAAMFVLFIWSIRKTLRPFRTLSAELQSKLGSDKVGPSKGEADIIRSGFNYLLTSIQDMNDSLHDYRAIAKEQFLREWLLQGTPQIPNGGIAISPLSEFDFLRVSVIRIESYKRFVETYNYNSRKLLKYAMGNISEEVLREKGYVSDWVDMGSDHLVLLIGASGEGDQADQLLAALTTVGRQIETYLRLHTAIACSSRLSIKDSLKQDYQDTYELTLLKFFTGVDKVYNEEDLEASFQSEQSYPDEGAMNELIAAIKQNAQQHIPGLLDRLLNHLKGVSYNQFLFQLQMIVFTIFKSFNRVTTMKETLVTELTTGRFSSLDEARGWLESEIRQVMESLSQPNAAGRKAEIVQEINDYVRNHLQDPFLSADTIADHLGYSSSYLRRLYKEAAQTTLADYILSERIEQVKQYLLRTDETLAVIAAKTGFQTRSHFFSTFKKSTGLTPSQYRESMAE
jgi:AraC-like DNA-binding protein